MRRLLLSPKWVLGHVLVIAFALLFLRLGWWQWDRARSTGSMQNLGYALQWPLFAVFGVLGWVRILRDTLRPPQPPTARADRQRRVAPTSPPQASGPSAESSQPDEPNDELAAYNRYLAWLHAQDQQQLR